VGEIGLPEARLVKAIYFVLLATYLSRGIV